MEMEENVHMPIHSTQTKHRKDQPETKRTAYLESVGGGGAEGTEDGTGRGGPLC